MSSEHLSRRTHRLDPHLSEVRERYRAGESGAQIAATFGVTRGTVYSFIGLRGLARLTPHHNVRPLTPIINPNGRIRLADIKKAVCEHFRLTLAQIEGESRARREAWPRMLAMTLSRDLTGQSYPAIGQRYGNRDHTTVLSAMRVMRARMNEFPAWAEHYGALKTYLTTTTPIAEAAE